MTFFNAIKKLIVPPTKRSEQGVSATLLLDQAQSTPYLAVYLFEGFDNLMIFYSHYEGLATMTVDLDNENYLTSERVEDWQALSAYIGNWAEVLRRIELMHRAAFQDLEVEEKFHHDSLDN